MPAISKQGSESGTQANLRTRIMSGASVQPVQVLQPTFELRMRSFDQNLELMIDLLQ